MSGPRSAPADLPGFTLLRGIGGGGFADVFLYREDRLDREVAVKILRAEHVSAASLRQFETEANVMARTSAHPYIVTIYGSGVATDGRPYIAMEYYPLDHFGLRARGGKLAIAEVLRVGVQVASAVETAHRAGIVHRDIKPANILTSEYGRPGLTDFGISGVRLDDHVEAAAGVTVAFAGPEVLRDDADAGNELSDIYSLTATLYTLLAGRSPFWIPGGDNTDHAVFARAVNGNAPPLDRPDVSPALNHLLRHGMAVDPADRPQTALALARGLQDIEQQLSLAPTPIEVRDAGSTTAQYAAPLRLGPEAPTPVDAEEDEGTRRAMPKSVNPDGEDNLTRARTAAVSPTPRPVIEAMPSPAPPAAPTAASTWAAPTAAGLVPESPWAAPAATSASNEAVERHETVARKPAPPPEATAAATADHRTAFIVVGAVAAALVVVVAGFLVTRDGGGTEPPTTTTTTRPPVTEVVLDTPDTPTKVRAVVGADGRMTVEIPPHGPALSGATSSVAPVNVVSYRLIRTDNGGASWPTGQTKLDAPGAVSADGTTTIVVEGLKPTERPCFQMSAMTTNRISDPTAEICAAAPAAPTP